MRKAIFTKPDPSLIGTEGEVWLHDTKIDYAMGAIAYLICR